MLARFFRPHPPQARDEFIYERGFHGLE
jgi:hypothetical protein